MHALVYSHVFTSSPQITLKVGHRITSQAQLCELGPVFGLPKVGPTEEVQSKEITHMEGADEPLTSSCVYLSELCVVSWGTHGCILVHALLNFTFVSVFNLLS